MHIQQFRNPSTPKALPAKLTQEKPDGPSPEEPKESFASKAGGALYTVASRTLDSVLYTWAGGGTMAGTITAGAIIDGVGGAVDGALMGYQRSKETGHPLASTAAYGLALGGVSAGLGAAKGWSTFVLGQAFGGGLGGAVLAGAALGVGEAAADLIFK